MATIHRMPHPEGSSRAAKRRPAKARRSKKSQSLAKSVASRLQSAATSSPAKAAYVAIGTIGLAAVAVAILGPKRLEREVLNPLRKAVGPPAEKMWDQAKPLREQLTGLFQRAGAEREQLASDFQSWIGHFRSR